MSKRIAKKTALPELALVYVMGMNGWKTALLPNDELVELSRSVGVEPYLWTRWHVMLGQDLEW